MVQVEVEVVEEEGEGLLAEVEDHPVVEELQAGEVVVVVEVEVLLVEEDEVEEEEEEDAEEDAVAV